MKTLMLAVSLLLAVLLAVLLASSEPYSTMLYDNTIPIYAGMAATS
jgi:hypothetical protein